jgi:cytochrome c oxidase cbb3-type subunit 2
MKGDPVTTDKDPTRHIEIVLFGLKATAISGVNYTAPMPAQAEMLSDSEIAAVINYERKSWGNNAPTITPEDVAKIRNHHQEGKEEHR